MDTDKQFIITVSREIGSGGRTVGRKLSEKLGVHYSDKELIKALREKFNLTTERIEKLKGEKKNWFDDFVQFVAPVPRAGMFLNSDPEVLRQLRPDLTTNDLFAAESQILKAIAEKGSCVIAGRSAFFVLKDCPNKVDIFITASRKKRLERVMQKQGLTEEQASELIDRVDSGRENYVKRYTGLSRYDARNYDLVLNMDQLPDEDAAVAVILQFIGAKSAR